VKQSAREWQRLYAAYELENRRQVARYEGLTTRVDKLKYKLMSLQFQFLPHCFTHVPEWRVRLRSLRGPRTYPDFVCSGAIKSGTSDLGTYLFQHPCIMIPLTKEPTQRNPAEWLPYYPTVKEKERVAREHGQALSGLFTPGFATPFMMEAFYKCRPNGKVILMLRNPTDRFYSQYKWDILVGGKPLHKSPYYNTFAMCVERELSYFPAVSYPSPSRVDLLQVGIYFPAVEMWMKRFGREQVYILRAEDFFADPASAVCGIHEFLGIPPQRPEIHKIVNQNPMKAPPMDKESRQKLQAFYRPWNEKLYALIGRDTKWD
jgi:hypothetical protein